MIATYIRPCDNCGVDVETGGDYPRSRPRFCPDCTKGRKRQMARAYYHQTAHKRPPVELAREPVKIVDISPEVKDSEMRWYLSGYKGNVMPWWSFKESLPDGTFDGLVIERGGRRSEVWAGKLVQPGEYRQGGLLEAQP